MKALLFAALTLGAVISVQADEISGNAKPPESAASAAARVLNSNAAHAGAASADGKVWMRLDLKPGQIYSGRLETKSSTRFQAEPTLGSQTSSRITFLMRVLGKADNGDTLVRLTISSVRMEGRGPQILVIVDSEHPE